MRILFTLIFAALALFAYARKISPDEAQNLASDYFYNSIQTKGSKGTVKRVASVKATNGNEFQPYYIFNTTDNKGFVIISGDDRVNKILGYSDIGNFSFNTIPPQLSELLNQFSEKLDSLPASVPTHPSWLESSGRVAESDGILLETANWGQGYPYNTQTPVIEGEHSPTGCVATAMAIVMKYHNWPLHTYGNNVTNFYHNDITINFDNHEINWERLDEPSETFAEEVSNLMLLTGTSVHTQYDPWGSGASMYGVCHELITKFGYIPDCCYLTKKFYDEEKWCSLIDDQLHNGLPIIYGSTIDDSWQGHTYVIDGKKGDSYHINWGWDGFCNGYFDLNLLNPDGINYNGHQSMIINIKPDLNPTPQSYSPLHVVYGWNATYRTGEINSNTSEIKKNELITFTGPVLSFPLFNGLVNYALIDENDNILEFATPYMRTLEMHRINDEDPLSAEEFMSWPPHWEKGWTLENSTQSYPIEACSLSDYCRTFAFTQTNIKPNYRIILMSKENSENEWKQVLGLNGMLNYVPVTGINSQWAEVEWDYDSDFLEIKQFDPHIVGESLTRILRYQDYKQFNLIYKSGNSQVYINNVLIDNSDYSDDYLGEFYETIPNEFPRLLFPSNLPDYKIKIDYIPDPEIGCLATSIRLDKDVVTMPLGESLALNAEVLPKAATNRQLNWESNDESVATVDENGVITALHEGAATITAYAKESPEASAQCLVFVEAPILAESLTIDHQTLHGEAGDTFRITAIILPDNTWDKTLKWETSNPEIASVDETGLVTILQNGMCTITAKTTDGSNLEATCMINSTTFVDEVFTNNYSTVDVYNTLGILLKRNCTKFQLQQFSPGIYIIRDAKEYYKILLK